MKEKISQKDGEIITDPDEAEIILLLKVIQDLLMKK